MQPRQVTREATTWSPLMRALEAAIPQRKKGRGRMEITPPAAAAPSTPPRHTRRGQPSSMEPPEHYQDNVLALCPQVVQNAAKPPRVGRSSVSC